MMRKRPCAICHQWFYPHPRVGKRQRACCHPVCQAQRRKQTQAAWRAKNPDYDLARYVQLRFAGTRETQGRDPIRVHGRLKRLPWDLVQDEIGAKTTDIIAYLARLLQKEVQDQIRGYVSDIQGNFQRQPRSEVQDPIPDVVSVVSGDAHAETTFDRPQTRAPP